MITLRQSPFDLFERLDQQLSQAERVPAAEIHDTPGYYTVRLELPGVSRDSIDVKATDRTLSVSAERRRPVSTSDSEENPGEDTARLSEFRYGTWSRSFRFGQGLNRDAVQASYRDGVLEITAAKAQSHTSVTVAVDV